MTAAISRNRARRLVISAQGLHQKNAFSRGKAGVLEVIRHLGYVQMDTISVIQRAHHHVLWSRVNNYALRHLHTLQQKDRTIMEYWAHAKSYLPMSDYRFTLPLKKVFAEKNKSYQVPDRLKKEVLQRIELEGPLMARDFEGKKSNYTDAWQHMKPAKRALERLFYEGQLEISHREKFQIAYDLKERVIPSHIDTSFPTSIELARYLIEYNLRSRGLVTLPQIAYLRREISRKTIQKVLSEEVDKGSIISIRIKGLNEPFYSKSELLDQPIRMTSQVKILSPFDNMTIQRERLSQIFEFDYQIECYVPKNKRKYGYFCLPVLFKDQIVGRIDCKADRKNNVLKVLSEHFERPIDRHLYEAELLKFAQFNGCHSFSRKH